MREVVVSKLQENNNVSQANSLVEARYKVTKVEQKLLFSMISLIEPKHKKFPTFSVESYQLSEILNLDRKSSQRELEIVIDRLMSRVIKVFTANGWKRFNWLRSAELNKNIVHLKFHDDLKPYLLELKASGNFTQSKLGLAISFRGVYTIRIYQLLKEYHSKRIYEFEFSLEDFRKMMLGEKSKKYIRLYHFKDKVIKSAQKELSKIDEEKSTEQVTVYKSDLNFHLETRRTGRKISHLKFIIYPQNVTPPPQRIIKQRGSIEEETQGIGVPKVILEYEEYGVMRATTQPYLEERGEQALINTLERFKDDQKEGKIKKNIGGYLAHLLKSNAGQKTKAEIEEEKKKEEAKIKAEEAKKQKFLQGKYQEFKNEFGLKAREEFINSLTEKEREKIRQDFINGSDAFFANAILKGNDLFHPAYGGAVIPLIPQYEQQKEAYANQKLQELGLIN